MTNPDGQTETYVRRTINVAAPVSTVGGAGDTPVDYATFAEVQAKAAEAAASATAAAGSKVAAETAQSGAVGARDSAIAARVAAEAAKSSAEASAGVSEGKAAEASAHAQRRKAKRTPPAPRARVPSPPATWRNPTATTRSRPRSPRNWRRQMPMPAKSPLEFPPLPPSRARPPPPVQQQPPCKRGCCGQLRWLRGQSAVAAALIAAGLVYVSDIAGTAVPATATASGYFYVIASGGSSQGKTWAKGDIAIYKGASCLWSQLSGLVVAGDGIAQQIASRASADYLQSDGATSARRIETVYGALGAVAGSDLSEVDYVCDVPTANPADTAIVAAFTPNATTSPDFQPWALAIIITSGGALLITQRGASTGDSRVLTFAGWRAAYSGRRARLTVAFTGNSATVPVVYQDGTPLTGGVETTNGAPPNWVPASLATSYHVAGYNWPAGYFRRGRPVNRKYAQADVDFVQLTGRLSYADAAGGSMVAAISWDFSSSSGWTVAAGNTISGGVANFVSGGRLYGQQFYPARLGARVRVRFDYTTATAGNLNFNNFAFTPTFTASTFGVALSGSGSFDQSYIVTGSWGTTTQGFDFISAGWVGTMDNLRLDFLGALSDPIIQPCPVLDDATGNNRASLLVGFAPVTSRKDWRVPAFVDMSTTGNKQLLGGAILERPAACAIDTIETTCAGAPTFSVGDGVTATRYTASAAHTSGRTRETIANPFPADAAKTGIYANVTTAHASSGAELIVIRGHRE